MARTWQTARKSTPASARSGRRLLCTYVRKTNVQSAQFVDSDSSSSDSEDEAPLAEEQPIDVQDVPAVFHGHGVDYTHTVTASGLPGSLLQAFNGVKQHSDHLDLPQASRDVLTGNNKAYKSCRLENHGKEAFTNYAVRDIEQGELVMTYGGHLYTREAWDQAHPDNGDNIHLWTFDLPAKLFKRRGYRGPDLVIAGDVRGNEGRWLHDPSWHIKTWPPRPNLVANVLWTTAPSHPDQVLPYAVFIADRDIRSGEELLLYWGDQCWEALSKHETHAQAAESWRAHFKLALLQRYQDEVRAKGLGANDGASVNAGPSGSNPASAGASGSGGRAADRSDGYTTEAGDGGVMGDADGGPDRVRHWRLQLARTEEADASAAAAAHDPNNAAGGSAAARPRPKYEAVVFDRSTGRYSSSTNNPSSSGAPVLGPSSRIPPKGVSFRRLSHEEVVAAFPGYRAQPSFDQLPASLRHEMNSTQRRKTPHCTQLTDRERELIASGELPGCVVAEVRALHHPVRWATPPNYKAYTVLADKSFAADEPIGIYSGDMRTAQEMDLIGKPEKEMYAFALLHKELSQERPGMRWPRKGLVVDALDTGNYARFINDVWGHDQDREPNVEPRVVWDEQTQRPYVMLYATHKIRRGQELVMSYGSDYWVFFARHLQLVHNRFHDRTTAREARLQEGIRRAEGEERLEEVVAAIEERVNVRRKKLYDEEDDDLVADLLEDLGVAGP